MCQQRFCRLAACKRSQPAAAVLRCCSRHANMVRCRGGHSMLATADFGEPARFGQPFPAGRLTRISGCGFKYQTQMSADIAIHLQSHGITWYPAAQPTLVATSTGLPCQALRFPAAAAAKWFIVSSLLAVKACIIAVFRRLRFALESTGVFQPVLPTRIREDPYFGTVRSMASRTRFSRLPRG